MNNYKKINNKTSVLTVGPYEESEKVYLKGKIYPDIRVPMRKVNLDKKANPNYLYLYDTSGIYTEITNNKNLKISNGLGDIRYKWIKERKEIEKYLGRKINSKDNGFRKINSKILKPFRKKNNNCFRANKNKGITQLYFAKKGVVTEEMEFVALRENEERKY